MIKSILRILFFILIAPAFAIADAPESKEPPNEYKMAIDELMSAKSIECYFPQGSHANWKGTSMKLEEDRMSNAIYFDNIDISDKNQARIIANGGAGDVRAFMSPTGITFIEMTGIGNAIYTTVFPSYLGNKKINSEPLKDIFHFQKAYIAVTSRHIYAPVIGAMPSQFHGYCRILE